MEKVTIFPLSENPTYLQNASRDVSLLLIAENLAVFFEEYQDQELRTKHLNMWETVAAKYPSLEKNIMEFRETYTKGQKAIAAHTAPGSPMDKLFKSYFRGYPDMDGQCELLSYVLAGRVVTEGGVLEQTKTLEQVNNMRSNIRTFLDSKTAGPSLLTYGQLVECLITGEI